MFKCPAWPELVAQVQEVYPLYIHFPLLIGWGRGTPLDGETNQPVDWQKVESLLASTGTPFVNLHLAPEPEHVAGLAASDIGPDAISRLVEGALRDVADAVRRFGKERVTLDLSHARLAADALGSAPAAYLRQLPLERTREIHLTGIQKYSGDWLARLRQGGVDAATIDRFAGKRMDHLPLVEADWQWAKWLFGEIQAGRAGQPWVAAFEYGGIGPFWEALCIPEVLEAQVNRLYGMCHPVSQPQV